MITKSLKLQRVFGVASSLFFLFLSLFVTSCSWLPLPFYGGEGRNSEDEVFLRGLERRNPVRQKHEAEVVGIFPITDGQGDVARIVSVDKAGEVLLWDLATGEARILTKVDFAGDLVVFEATKMLLAVSEGNELRLYDLKHSLRPPQVWDSLQTRITALAFEPGGDSLLLGGADGQVYRWLIQKVQRYRRWDIERYTGHSGIVGALAYHPLGRVFFSADWNGGLSAWLAYDQDAHGGRYDKSLLGSRFFQATADRKTAGRLGQERIELLKSSQDGQLLVAATQSGMLEIWKIRGLKKMAVVQAHRGLIYAALINADQNQIVTAGRDGLVKVWKYEKASEQRTSQNRDGLPWKLEELSVVELSGVRALAGWGRPEYLAGTVNGELVTIEVSTASQTATKEG